LLHAYSQPAQHFLKSNTAYFTRITIDGNSLSRVILVYFNRESSPALPFCSERCRQIDLGRWLDERNGLPYESPTAPEEDAAPPPDKHPR
jgi:uncharacterized protein